MKKIFFILQFLITTGGFAQIIKPGGNIPLATVQGDYFALVKQHSKRTTVTMEFLTDVEIPAMPGESLSPEDVQRRKIAKGTLTNLGTYETLIPVNNNIPGYKAKVVLVVSSYFTLALGVYKLEGNPGKTLPPIVTNFRLSMANETLANTNKIVFDNGENTNLPSAKATYISSYASPDILGVYKNKWSIESTYYNGKIKLTFFENLDIGR